jgi:hypothetical protein
VAFPSLACLKTHTACQASTFNCSDESIFRSRSWKPGRCVYLNPHNLTMKKYEIYLPLRYNDGKEIEPQKLKQIREQLIAVFGAITVSSLSAPFQGTWRYGGVEFMDDIIRIEVITEKDLSSNRFFKNFKRQLKGTLHQFDILITVYDIETI